MQMLINATGESQFNSAIRSQPINLTVDASFEAESQQAVADFLAADASNQVVILVANLANYLHQLSPKPMPDQSQLAQYAAQWQALTQSVLTVHKLDRRRIRLVEAYHAQFDPHGFRVEFHLALDFPPYNFNNQAGYFLLTQWVTAQPALAELDQQLQAATRSYNQAVFQQQRLTQAFQQCEREQQQQEEQNKESGLLLSQLHQVQEELERKFIENGELNKQQERLSQQLLTEQKQLSKTEQLNNSLNQQISQALAENAALQQKNQQAEQAQQAAEQKAKTELDALKQQHAKELNSLDESLKQEKANNKELAEENELLLNQMFQVQEALEQELISHRNSPSRAVEPASQPMIPVNQESKPTPLESKAKPRLSIMHRVAMRYYPKVKLLKRSGLFDEAWYLQQNPDVAHLGLDPVFHYLRFGASEGRNPRPDFDGAWYLSRYPDVKKARLNPFVHYVAHGKQEKRLTAPHVFYNR